MEKREHLQDRLKSSFLLYGEEVAINRSIPDARDGLKLGMRQGLYSQYTNKITSKYPFKKALKSVAAAMAQSYTHGDAAMYDTFIRAAKPWVYRYPLEEAQGAYGSPCATNDHSASRYVEMRSAKIADHFFTNIEKNSITDWYDNYDDTEKIPGVLPSVGFWGLVNGVSGIAVGFTTSISPMNLIEVNNALITLLYNPNATDDEIYCAPDYPSGCLIINGNEAKESILNGSGKAVKMRAYVEYDEKKNALIITHMPWGVYTNKVIAQIKELIEVEELPGVEKVVDHTKKQAEIHVLLSKKVNPDKVTKILYSKTSIQSSCSVKTVMLDKGRYPKVFSWREALQAHLEHEKIVYKRSFEFDRNKFKARLNIVNGLLIALAKIEEVIHTIKTSPTAAAAKENLKTLYLLNEAQAKAILDMKLSRLAHLEVEKLQKEKEELITKISHINEILNNQELFYKEIEKGLREVANKFGDERRTKILNMDFSKDDDEEPIEQKELYIYLTNEGNLYTNEVSTLYTQRRGGRGAKIKMNKNEYIITSQQSSNANMLLAFSNKGKVYSLNLADFPTSGRVNIGEFFTLDINEQIINIAPCGKKDKYNSVVFITKNGLIKKTDFSEYKIKKSKGVIAIKLKEDDEIVSTMFVNNENIGFLTNQGYFLIIDIEKVNSIGRATTGVKGIKLSTDDYVVDARKIKQNCKEIVSITKNGLISRTNRSEFTVGTRATKGVKIQTLKDNDSLTSFLPINDKEEILVVSNKGIINLRLVDVHITARGAVGNIAKKLITNEYITNLM